MYGEKQSRDTWAGMMERPTSGTPKYLDSGNPGGRSRKFVAGGESGISGTDGGGGGGGGGGAGSNRCLQGVRLISYCPLSSEGNTKNQHQIISGCYSETMIDDVSLITDYTKSVSTPMTQGCRLHLTNFSSVEARSST
jgi:hypothetical protein